MPFSPVLALHVGPPRSRASEKNFEIALLRCRLHAPCHHAPNKQPFQQRFYNPSLPNPPVPTLERSPAIATSPANPFCPIKPDPSHV